MNELNKKQRGLKISAGLLVGYLLGGSINMLVFGKTWSTAFSEKALLFGIVGIAASIFVISRLRRKEKRENTN